MARRNDDTAGRILTWFVAALLIIATVAGVKYVLETDLKPKDDESSVIVPISSEEPPVSSEDEELDPQPEGLVRFLFEDENNYFLSKDESFSLLKTNVKSSYIEFNTDDEELEELFDSKEFSINGIFNFNYIELDDPDWLRLYFLFGEFQLVLEVDKEFLTAGVYMVEVDFETQEVEMTHRPYYKSDFPDGLPE